jgi:hypothetical protein
MSYLDSLFAGIVKEGSPTLAKIAFKLNPMGKAEVKAKNHFEAQDKNWKQFEKQLKSPNFRAAVLATKEADPVLQRYVKTFGAFQGSKNVIAKVKSADSGRTYTIKELPNGRWGCNCGDWQFKHAIKGGACKHIKSLRQSKMVKQSSLKGMAIGALTANKVHKDHEHGRKAEDTVKRVHREIGYRPPRHPSLFSGLTGPL